MDDPDPRFESIPEYEATVGDDAVAFAAEAGLFLDPWQCRVLAGSMGLKRGGKWSARQVGLLVPRQNGKGSVLEARELYAMFVGDERLIIHSAHRYDTSQDHFKRILELIENNPDLDRHIRSVSKVIGKETINLKSRTALKFKARTLSGSGRGFSSDLLILDEAFLLPEQSLDAMMPTLAARPNPQVWFTSSSGTPDSAALWRVVRRGRDRAANLAYWEWGIETGADVTDRDLWRAVNPGRASIEYLEDEFVTLTPEGFAREHLGAWDDSAIDTVIPIHIWNGLADLSPEPPKPAGKVAYSIDTTWTRSASSISVAGERPDGHPQIQVVANRPDVTWVVPHLKLLTENAQSLGVVIDMQSAAASLLEDLREANIEIIEMTTSDAKQAFGQFHDAAIDHRLRHLNQPELNAALVGASSRSVGDALLWDRKKPEVDITPIVSATNALWGWTTRHATGKFQGSIY